MLDIVKVHPIISRVGQNVNSLTSASVHEIQMRQVRGVVSGRHGQQGKGILPESQATSSWGSCTNVNCCVPASSTVSPFQRAHRACQEMKTYHNFQSISRFLSLTWAFIPCQPSCFLTVDVLILLPQCEREFFICFQHLSLMVLVCHPCLADLHPAPPISMSIFRPLLL